MALSAENESSLLRLKEQLEKSVQWPSEYMFKLIFPSDIKNFALVRELFPEESQFESRNSSSGKYTIVTVREFMLSSEEVITRYRLAAEIPGLIML